MNSAIEHVITDMTCQSSFIPFFFDEIRLFHAVFLGFWPSAPDSCQIVKRTLWSAIEEIVMMQVTKGNERSHKI